GRALSRHCGEKRILKLRSGERWSCVLRYDSVLLGNGRYFFSAAIYKELDLAQLSAAKFYDLLSRSFEFGVIGQWVDDPGLFSHPSTWVECSAVVSESDDHARVH